MPADRVVSRLDMTHMRVSVFWGVSNVEEGCRMWESVEREGRMIWI